MQTSAGSEVWLTLEDASVDQRLQALVLPMQEVHRGVLSIYS